ncbi:MULTISPECIES: BTAD domain-containing putative transcriptional regulator [unclassified Streptomyces]|uniref:AfsR/SARP family transcriptional regulator n=1 Tax=unclassified Streptomyces TaxID=2593676 RepID=UPI002366B7D1|nr:MULTISPECIES: BTAD domain-containing putative transcriptional regulator [unclassified Streptomyces]MDF3144965.1 BTAD domain-containing putative transcriptional regulator [Streptomyces sp. T21Q-yed]WDF39441.1 BTAD domain-containing putative transcriptional regulator [Streptomyces sp. T12]
MEIRLLGPVQAWADGAEVDLGRPRQRCVLAVLLMEANRVVPIETLIDRVWGDDPPDTVRNVVYGYVGRLKSALREAGRGSTGVHLDRSSGGYTLRTPTERVDLYRFRDLVGQARAKEKEARAREGEARAREGEARAREEAGTAAAADDQVAELLERALQMWRGEPLTGLTGAWAQATRDRLASERVVTLLQYHEVQLRRGRHEEIFPRLRELAAAHPLDERMAGQLLTALYRCGLQAEALLHYDDIRKRLAEDLGVDPAPELQTLHQLILTNDPAAGAPTPGQRGRPDRDITPSVPAELPHDAAGFAGRTDELVRLHALLPPEQGPGPANTVVISAIGGAAGIGKTALAVHWAHQVRARFPDGQLYVNLHGFDHDRPPLKAGEALELLLRGLGLRASEIPLNDEAQARAYRTLLAGRRLLVLLDNAASAEQVRPLLPGSPSCCVVVTSRNRLGDLVARDGAHALPLDLLLPAEARALLSRALGEDRLGEDPPAVEELIRLCGSLPLALRVAAARLTGDPGLRPADLVAEMSEGNRLEALAPDDTDDSPLRTAFSASYRVLSPAARRLFRLLGLFPGPEFTAEVAAAFLEIPLPQARRPLGALAAAHLIEPAAAGRYRFHDLLREYALERARAEETAADRDAALRRVLVWYLNAARATGGSWLFPELPHDLAPGDRPNLPPASGAGQWLEAERANLLALINHTGRHGPRPIAWHLTNALFGDFWLHLPRATWQAITQTALDAAAAEGDLHGQAAMHTGLGLLKSDRGWGGQAMDHHTRVREISREIGWVTGEAAGLGGLAQAEWNLARLDSAHEHVTASLRIARAAGNLHVEALGLVTLGVTCRDLGRLREAADHLETAIRRNEEIGWHDHSLALQNLGWTYWELGRLTEGLAILGPKVSPDLTGGYRNDRAMMLDSVARIKIELGRHEEALHQAERALAVGKAKGRRWIQAGILNTIAAAHRELAHPDRAERAGRQALTLAQQSGHRRTEADCTLGLSLTLGQLGRHDQARSHAEQALSLARDHSFRVVEAQALSVLCDIAESEAAHAAAVALGHEALAIHRETGHRLGEARTLMTLGRVLRPNEAAAADLMRQQARAIFSDVGVPPR